jgi:hypothetical protein
MMPPPPQPLTKAALQRMEALMNEPNLRFVMAGTLYHSPSPKWEKSRGRHANFVPTTARFQFG